MDDVLHQLLAACRRGETVGVATVVDTFESAPQPAGARMIVFQDGTVAGSVSGGCVEGALYALSQEIMDEGTPRLQRYGISNENAFEAGLTCGGILDVFVERMSAESIPELEDLLDRIERGEPVALATVVEHIDPLVVGSHLIVGAEGSQELRLAADAQAMLAMGETGLISYCALGEPGGVDMRVFVQSWAAKPRMVIFGAVDFAAALAVQGKLLNYHVTICDARPVFATTARFPAADEVVVDWPHRWLSAGIAAGSIDNRSVICVLTHDPKFDVPVLEVALRLTGPQAPAFIGAMGSRSTHVDRVSRLRAQGVTDEELGRMSSPIGLDLGGRTPQETAISIVGEIIALRSGGSGSRLSDVAGRIHSTGDSALEAMLQ